MPKNALIISDAAMELGNGQCRKACLTIQSSCAFFPAMWDHQCEGYREGKLHARVPQRLWQDQNWNNYPNSMPCLSFHQGIYALELHLVTLTPPTHRSPKEHTVIAHQENKG